MRISSTWTNKGFRSLGSVLTSTAINTLVSFPIFQILSLLKHDGHYIILLRMTAG
jgi:hypothetical protein